MTQITDTIQFDESKELLSGQSSEFQTWFNENVNAQITDRLQPVETDEYSRPKTYNVEANSITFLVSPNYLYAGSASWANSGLTIKIKQ
ncbi:MAG: hypothetical protein P4L28_12160 [Paludibacteraceae bacterium]|nr:hypothetical protein [Paludibacteraceae bacterium]